MKIILLNTKTGLFVDQRHTWTKDVYQATAFETVMEAVSFCATRAIEDVHYMLRFERDDIQPLSLGPSQIRRRGVA